MYGREGKEKRSYDIVADRTLNYEASRINYSLRSTFFYRKLNELGYFQILSDIDFLVRHSANYSWEDRKYWNITHNAWDSINKRTIEPLRVFAHPKVLLEHPMLVAYYRNIAAISLKGVQYLTFNVESALSVTMNNLTALMYSSAGTTVDGSWRNKIGDEAETMVKSYIARPAIENGWVDSLIDKNNSPVEFDPAFDYIANISLFRGIKLKNKRALLFSSEPDISFISEDGRPVTVIEVKGGTDPAGALERLESDQLINEVYNLTSLILDMDYGDSFISKLMTLLT